MKGVLFRGGMLVYAARYWRPLQRLADDPDAAQAQVLPELLSRNSGTDFGATPRFRPRRRLRVRVFVRVAARISTIAVRPAAGDIANLRLRIEIPGDPAACARRIGHYLSWVAESVDVSAASRGSRRTPGDTRP